MTMIAVEDARETWAPAVSMSAQQPDAGAKRFQRLFKRSLDVVAAAAMLLLLSPLLLVIVVVLLVGEGRPVFFSQTRVGQDGRHFRLWKFRTMVVDADKKLDALRVDNERGGPLFKVAADPRVTRTGSLLRKTSLDEVPQLWNVLRGSMSMVGPRPALPEEVASFSPAVRVRERVPAGLTGLWQVEARDSADFEQYAELDRYYVREWNAWLDLKILMRTPAAVWAHARASRDAGDAPVSAADDLINS